MQDSRSAAKADAAARILADTMLPDDIGFEAPINPHALAPRAVCLTGATGFLGGYLLHGVMTRTEADAYCLIRGADMEAAKARLVQHLVGYGLWDRAFASRIHAVPVSNLGDRQFGLNRRDYHDLAAKVDVIYHSAGSLNMASQYDRLRRTNVLGTLEVVRLASTGTLKPLHFLSSLVVFFSDAHTGDTLLREADAPRYDDSLKGGYSKSKWVADRLVAAAGERGLPVTIHRPVRVMGSAATGAMIDLSDILPLLIKACVLLGRYPDFDVPVTMVPVDCVTDAMVHLAGTAAAFGRAFHYFHPNPIPWRALMGLIRDLGYPMQEMPFADWQRTLKTAASVRGDRPEYREYFANAFLAVMAPHFLLYPRPPLDAANLEAAHRASGTSYPPIDRTLIGTYFDYWRAIGFVPDPPGMA
ncbi:MAG: thioester reductase domain-containing protein [Paracraurococcus sp.]